MRGLMFGHRPAEVAILPKGALKADGTQAYDEGEIHTLAWVRDKIGMLRKADGREIQFSRMFLFDKTEVVKVGDRIRFEGRNHEVLMVTVGKDVNGTTDHKKALTGVA